MLFPDKITIFHHEVINGEDVYTCCVVPEVYWYGTTGVTASGKGMETSDAVTIVTSPAATKSYKKKWKVSKGDRIVKGEHPAITSLKDLNSVESDSIITVISFAAYIVDSDVDNVTITGK